MSLGERKCVLGPGKARLRHLENKGAPCQEVQESAKGVTLPSDRPGDLIRARLLVLGPRAGHLRLVAFLNGTGAEIDDELEQNDFLSLKN